MTTRAQKKADFLDLLNQIEMLKGVSLKDANEANQVVVENFFKFSPEKRRQLILESKQQHSTDLSTIGSKMKAIHAKLEEEEI